MSTLFFFSLLLSFLGKGYWFEGELIFSLSSGSKSEVLNIKVSQNHVRLDIVNKDISKEQRNDLSNTVILSLKKNKIYKIDHLNKVILEMKAEKFFTQNTGGITKKDYQLRFNNKKQDTVSGLKCTKFDLSYHKDRLDRNISLWITDEININPIILQYMIPAIFMIGTKTGYSIVWNRAIIKELKKENALGFVAKARMKNSRLRGYNVIRLQTFSRKRIHQRVFSIPKNYRTISH